MIRYSIIRVSIDYDSALEVFGPLPWTDTPFRLTNNAATQKLFNRLLSFNSMSICITDKSHVSGSQHLNFSKERVLVNMDFIFSDPEEALIYKLGWDHTILEEK